MAKIIKDYPLYTVIWGLFFKGRINNKKQINIFLRQFVLKLNKMDKNMVIK